MRMFRNVLFALAATLIAVEQPLAADSARQIEANGTTITYIDQGSGDPMVFIHGGLADFRTWAALQPYIADKRRFIAPNLRYFGEGEWADDGALFTADTHIADVAGFIRALDVGPVDIVGWSFGGDIATGVALAHPELIKTSIVFEPTLGGLIKEGVAGDPARQKQGEIFGPVIAALKAGDVAAGTKRSVEGVLGLAEGEFETLDEGFKTVFLQNARTLPLWLATPGVAVTCEMLGELDRPALVIKSDAGQAFFEHISDSMAECLRNGKLVVLPNSNHAGPGTQPEAMAAIVEAFLASH